MIIFQISFTFYFHNLIIVKYNLFYFRLEYGEFAIYNQNCFLERVSFGKQGSFHLNILIVLVYEFGTNK